MTRKIQVHQVDAFTRERFTGNPAGVVLNADVLTEAQMLAIARELNNADTAFILAPDGDDHTVRARFFTPRIEAGFVGHATVAAHTCCRGGTRRRAGNARNPRPASSTSRCAATTRTGASPSASSPPAIGRELNDRERLAVLDALALATEISIRAARCASSARRHAADDRRARPGAAEASEAGPGAAHHPVGADRRRRLLRLHADAAMPPTT